MALFYTVSVQERALDDSQRQELENKAAQYEEQLQKDEKNAYALEGGGATYAALGSYEKATSLLTRLTQQRPEDASSWRLLVSCKFSNILGKTLLIEWSSRA